MDDNKFGFKQGDLKTILHAISKFPGIKKAVVFGSRAKGNYQIGSDVDIAVWAITNNDVLQLSGLLNDETLLPYKFDVLNYEKINNTDLQEHIGRIGIEIYKAI